MKHAGQVLRMLFCMDGESHLYGSQDGQNDKYDVQDYYERQDCDEVK